MYLAGANTGTGMATAVDDCTTGVLIRPFLRAATHGRYQSAPPFLRAAPIRSAPMGRCAESLRAASHLRSVQASTSVNAPPFLRAASHLRSVQASTSVNAPPFLHAAPIICSRRNTNSLRAASHLHSVQASTSVKAPQFLRAGSIEEVRKAWSVKRMCSPKAVDNTGEDPNPKVPPTKWKKLVDLLIKLEGKSLLLLLLTLSVWIGFLAVKEKPLAKDIVDVCDKAHKIYNITSKAFLIIADLLKGGK